MPTPVITGTNQPVRKPDRVRYDPCRGLVREVSYEAANPAWLNAISATFLANFITYDLDGSTPGKITGHASGSDLGQPEVTTDNWQVLPNDLQIHIFETPLARSLESFVPGALSQVTRNLERMNSVVGITLGALLWNAPVVSGADLTVSTILLNRLLRNETHKGTSQYVLYHTTSVSQNSTANIADSHIDQIYTTAQLLSEVTDSTLWTRPLPIRLVVKIQNLPIPADHTAEGYTVGWRKLPAKEITDAGNRVGISSEYWYGQWDTLVKYDVYS